MKKKETIQSVLNLNKLVFDKIEFKRLGFSSNKELELEYSLILHKSKMQKCIKLH